MQRRAYLAALSVGLGGPLAGCSAIGDGGGDDSSTGTTADGGGGDGTVENTAGLDVELPLSEDELSRGAIKDAIPAITGPAFGPDWGETDHELEDDDRVIGVERDGASRAYPLRILNWHEIVNDEFDGPLLVTFCPLCGSGVTGVRTVDGEPTIFGVSGLLWKSDLVMYDERTESLWSQILAQAVRGPKTGERIELVPSSLTTWGSWREERPATSVLLPPPMSDTIGDRDGVRNYDMNPYASYEHTARIGIGRNDFEDDRLDPKTQVIGITHDGAARAYPRPTVNDVGVVNDELNGLPVVVTTDADDLLVAYERRVDDQVLTFDRADDRHLAAGGSRWSVVTGEAVDGPFEGSTVTRANDISPKFWFAWASFHPGTTIYDPDS